MATLTAVNPACTSSSDGALLAHDEYLVDGAATYNASQFCRLASDGLMYEAASSATSVAASAITHIAMETLGTAIGADTTRKSFGIVTPNQVFLMNELDGAVTEAARGQQFEMDVTSNLCTIDIDSNTIKVLQLVSPLWLDRPFQDDSADTLARVTVKVLTVAVEAAPAA